MEQFGPAGAIIIGFLGAVGALLAVFAYQQIRCRIKNGKQCGVIREAP